MGVATAEQWNGFYRRIPIKDLRCGVSEKTVNNVAKKNKFPNIHSILSTCIQIPAKHEKKVFGKKMLEVKLDGVRVITIVRTDGNVEQFQEMVRSLTLDTS